MRRGTSGVWRAAASVGSAAAVVESVWFFSSERERKRDSSGVGRADGVDARDGVGWILCWKQRSSDRVRRCCWLPERPDVHGAVEFERGGGVSDRRQNSGDAAVALPNVEPGLAGPNCCCCCCCWRRCDAGASLTRPNVHADPSPLESEPPLPATNRSMRSIDSSSMLWRLKTQSALDSKQYGYS